MESVPALRLLAPLLVLGLLLRPLSSAAEPLADDPERRVQLEALRSAILERLGMSAPPALRPLPLGAEEVRRLQRRYSEALAQLRTNQSLEATGSDGSSRLGLPEIRILTPKLELLQSSSTVRVQLLLERQALVAGTPEAQRLKRAQVQLFLPPPPRLNATGPATSGVDGETKTLRRDLTRQLRQWLESGQSREPLLRLPLALPPGVTQELLRRPRVPRARLRVKFQRVAGRERRGTRDKDCEQGRCCPRPLRVSLQEIGWTDWVIAPEEFEMRFCQGSCPRSYRPASMYAQLKGRQHSLSPSVVDPPCCVPSAYEPMVLMHYDSARQVTFTPFENLLPKTCHCA